MTGANRRGRPRPLEVIKRDERVYELLTHRPHSKAELIQLTGLTKAQTYLVLRRLYLDGRVQRVRQADHQVNVWEVT
jgi:predicted Rossmann fold nucleotide-binding protein DprA/Smf involved in DNA uptake